MVDWGLTSHQRGVTKHQLQPGPGDNKGVDELMGRQRSCLPVAFRVETEVQKQPQLFQGKIKAVARFNQHLFMQQTYRLRFGKTPSRGRDRTWQQGWRRGLWKGTTGGEVLRGQPLPEIKPLPLKTLLSNRLQVRRSNTGGSIHPQRT